VENWEVCDQESCSDHSIIKFSIGQSSWSCKQESQGVRYIVNSGDIDKFKGNLSSLPEERINTENTEGGSDDLDATLSERANKGTEIEKLIEEFQEVMKAACDKSFRLRTIKKITNSLVSWRTYELTVLRKKVSENKET